MKIVDRLKSQVGLGGGRDLPPPRLLAIADGLLITDRKAEAWYVIPTANTDLADEEARDLDHDRAVAVLTKTLKDRDCHLKVVWGEVSGEDYLAENGHLFTAPGGQQWAADRAGRIDELGLQQRHVLLGVHLADRDTRDTAPARGRFKEAIGWSNHSIPAKELAQLDGLARKLGRQLASSVWRARPATAEEIAWMVGREQHRSTTSPPRPGVIAGAALAKLTSGRVVPYTDHLRIYGVDGQVNAYVAVLVAAGFPEEMQSPGNGEWLRTLSEVDHVDDEGNEYDVIVEASVRFRCLSKKQARKRVEEARRSAKEQRQSAAKHSAGEAPEEVEETEMVLGEARKRILREGLALVEDHPRFIVMGRTREELEEAVDATVSHYAEMGIDVVLGADEQRDLWLETLPGDQVRVPDLGHVREEGAFAGSWFWGGARVGDDSGPVNGYTTGSTNALVHNDVSAGSSRGDATTTLFVGRAGRGKTTAVMLEELSAAFCGALVKHLDFKGDGGGLVTAAQRYGLPAQLTRVGTRHAGAADMFNFFAPQDAVLHVTQQLTLLAPEHLRLTAETPITAAAQHIAADPSSPPTTWAVIQRLRAHADPDVATLGEALAQLAQTPLGATVAGEPADRTDQVDLGHRPSIEVIQLPGMSLPSPISSPEKWKPIERITMACLRGFIVRVITLAGDDSLRGLRKVVAIPEVQLLTMTDDGAQFLDTIARLGRALGVSLLIDTQDPSPILHLPGLVEQITTVYGFQLTSKTQQNDLTELLNLEPSKATRALIRGLATGESADSIRHGHCVMRDHRDQVATVQIDFPSAQVKTDLSTTPDEQAYAEAHAPSQEVVENDGVDEEDVA